jgi:hypothetical protein
LHKDKQQRKWRARAVLPLKLKPTRRVSSSTGPPAWMRIPWHRPKRFIPTNLWRLALNKRSDRPNLKACDAQNLGLFSPGKTSALVGEIAGLEDFELISFLVIQTV